MPARRAFRHPQAELRRAAGRPDDQGRYPGAMTERTAPELEDAADEPQLPVGVGPWPGGPPPPGLLFRALLPSALLLLFKIDTLRRLAARPAANMTHDGKCISNGRTYPRRVFRRITKTECCRDECVRFIVLFVFNCVHRPHSVRKAEPPG